MQFRKVSTVVSVIAGLALLSTTSFSQTNTFSGRGTAASADILGIVTNIGDTGALPPVGGSLSSSLVTINVPGLLTASAASATATGAGNQSQSTASIANLNLSVATLISILTAGVIETTATATCSNGTPSVSGNSTIAGLTVLGVPITVTGGVNQTITLPLGLGSLVINEQIATANSITVNALHLTITAIADVVLAHSEADINCGPVTPPPPPGCTGDVLTGTGGIPGTIKGKKSNYGFYAGILNGAPFGNFAYDDLGTGLKVRSSAINAYTVDNATDRSFSGTATVNGVTGFTFFVIAGDPDPTTNPHFVDTLDLTVRNASDVIVYHNSGHPAQVDGKNEMFNPCVLPAPGGAKTHK
ncbi:MAG TPA: choice-of-anchor P family protein [Candidatus Angelobacter sp.]|nr:choice-of-anchor P family protein [Candidatus Angelobacter sp.]